MPMTTRFPLALGLLPALLAGCAMPPPATPSQQAEAASCTAQADAAYQAQNEDALSRTSQNGLLFAPVPNHVFDSQRLGSLHERDSAISDCEQNGDTTSAIAPGTPIVAPQIMTQ
jgi:hypothetical protein